MHPEVGHWDVRSAGQDGPLTIIAMTNDDTARLVQEALAGKSEAFTSLVKNYQDYAYGVAIGVLSDFELARDVVQESFLVAWRDLGKLQDPARFGGWLRGIVRNTSFHALRELKRVREMAEQMQDESGVLAPEPQEQDERLELVREALEGLDDKNREVASLYYVNGFSYKDISGFTGMSETAVQGRLQRARKKMKEGIEKMVRNTFKKKRLPDDFSSEIQKLLDATAQWGKQHEQAIKKLTKIGEPAVEPLIKAMEDERIAVRRAAARALCLIGDARALRPVLRILYLDVFRSENWYLFDEYHSGRVLAVPGMREELLKYVRDEKSEHREDVMTALSHLKGDEEVYKCLAEIAWDKKGQPYWLRRRALEAVCHLKPKESLEIICKGLQDPKLSRDSGGLWWYALYNNLVLPWETCLLGFGRKVAPNNRHFAAWITLRLGEKGRKELRRLVKGKDRDKKATAALALAYDDQKEAFEPLVEELVDGYSHQKWIRIISRTILWKYADRIEPWAAKQKLDTKKGPGVSWLLANVRMKRGEGTSKDVLYYGSPAARGAAAKKRAEEDGVKFLPELRRFLREGKPRKVAQQAFRQMYRLKEKAFPLAKEMLKSEHWTERKAGVCLLKRWGKLTTQQKTKAKKDKHVAVRHAVGLK